MSTTEEAVALFSLTVRGLSDAALAAFAKHPDDRIKWRAQEEIERRGKEARK